MKKIIYIQLIALFLFSCQENSDITIKRQHKTLINNENCDISFYYPKIITKDTNENWTGINKILYNIVDYEFYSHNCENNNADKNIISGDYKILYQTDSILSIEFSTFIKNFSGNKLDTIYHSLVFNTKLKTQNKMDLLWGIQPELIFKDFDRGKLKQFVVEYNKTNNYYANTLAYETGSNYVITWGLTQNKFIIYVGGEGEGFGYEKIEIALSEIVEN